MNALAWLSHDPRQADLDLFPALDRLEEGQECDVTICLHGNADPDTLVHVNAEWLDLAGQLPAVRMAQDIPFHSDHCAQVSLPPSKPGAWVVEASVETENREYRGTDIVVVSTGVETYKESLLRRIEPLLEEQFTPLAIDHPFSLRLDPASRTLQRPVLTTVWVSPLFFMVIVACLLMEWTLRRRWGYL